MPFLSTFAPIALRLSRFIFIVAFFSITSIQAAPVENFSAKYDVYLNGLYIAQTTRKLTSDKNEIIFTAFTETAGLASWFFSVTIDETSKSILKNNNISFFSYDYVEKNGDPDNNYNLKLINKNTSKNEPPQFYNSYKKQNYPATKNLRDTLGFIITIMDDLKRGERELEYAIAEKDNLKNYHLKFIKEEKLTTNNGPLLTLKMEHYDPKTKFRFTFWCAESMNFLPVRIRNIKPNGDEILLNLSQYNLKEIYLDLDDDDEDD